MMILDRSPALLVCFFFWGGMLFFGLCCNYARFRSRKKTQMHRVLTAALAVIVYGILQYVYVITNGIVQMDVQVPSFYLHGVFLAVSVILIWQQSFLAAWSRRNLTVNCIKESIDSLPDGLCYYWEGGLLKLANASIKELCRRITGTNLSDGEAFWQVLRSGADADGITFIQAGEHPIVCFSDGNVYSFCRRVCEMDEDTLYELVSTNVTEEHMASRRLEEHKEREAEINRRLRGLAGTITDMTIEKEVLAAKIRVHDNLGQALLSARRYLLCPQETDKEEMLGLLQRSVMLLKNESRQQRQDPYEESLRAAQLLGVEVHTSGPLPESGPARRIICLAIETCATNAIRHAGGNRLFITARRSDGRYTLMFRNNGKKPEQTIRETGGLANLRSETKRLKGAMYVQSRPDFVLMLELPDETGAQSGETFW